MKQSHRYIAGGVSLFLLANILYFMTRGKEKSQLETTV